MDNYPNTVTVDTKFSSSLQNNQTGFTPQQELVIKKKSNNGLKYTIVILVVFFLFGALGSTIYLVKNRTSYQSRASSAQTYVQPEPAGIFDAKNSYLSASPLEARAGGEENISLTVFLLDEQSKGVPGKVVVLSPVPGLTISQVQNISDSLGRAIFDISTNRPGDYFLQASAEGQTIPQKARVSFR